MDSQYLPMYQHPEMEMVRQSDIGLVNESVPINVPMGNPTPGTIGMPRAQISDNHATFTHKMHLNKIPVQQNYSQFPLAKEVDEDGRICGVALPETPAQLSTEGNGSQLEEVPQEEIKTEEEDISYFMETAHDIFLKISSKELTIKAAADLVGRKYSFMYRRYQQFCDNITDQEFCDNIPDQEFCDNVAEIAPKMKKKGTIIKRKGKKKRRSKRLTSSSKLKSSETIFKCEECPAILNTPYLIKTHAKVHEEDIETHTCTVCGIVFAKLFQLMRHRIEVHEEALQCPYCDSQFTIVANYHQHIRSHTGVKPNKCKECGQGFSSKFDLEIHIRKHTGERPFMCGICEKTFTSLKNLKGHQFVHSENPDARKEFDCDQCGRKYERNKDLMEHMNIHTGAKPYVCDICDARFNFKAGLDRHKMKHTGVQPYKCDICPAAFYQKKDIEQHKIVHTGIKAFKCDLCDYSCSRKHTLQYHKYTHTGERPYKCDFYGCTAAYTKPHSLEHHKLKHGLPPCKVCHEKFPDLNSLKRHMMIHTGEKPQTCEQCSKTFYKESSLKRHMYSHMYKPDGSKPKQARQNRKNYVDKNTIADNGHSMYAQSLITNVEATNSQTHYHPYTAVSQYSNLVNNSWPSTVDPDELRRRLLSSFK